MPETVAVMSKIKFHTVPRLVNRFLWALRPRSNPRQGRFIGTHRVPKYSPPTQAEHPIGRCADTTPQNRGQQAGCKGRKDPGHTASDLC